MHTFFANELLNKKWKMTPFSMSMHTRDEKHRGSILIYDERGPEVLFWQSQTFHIPRG